MVTATSRQTKAGPKPKARKFFGMSWNYRRGGARGLELENKDAVLRFLWINNPPRYSQLPERPHFLFDKKMGRPPRDIEE